MKKILIGVAIVVLVGGVYMVYQHQKFQKDKLTTQSPLPVPAVPATSTMQRIARNSVPVRNTISSQVSQTPTTTQTVTQTHTTTLDLHAIPIGDGRVSSSPKVGYVYSCQSTFTGGGADHAGDWINGSTWDLTKKIAVEGSNSWPNAQFSTYVQGSMRVLSGNGLPVGATTGDFPIAASDPAYQYDRNPNSVKAYTVSTQIPSSPTAAASPSCLPMGAIGYALNGVAIFNALDDGGRDAGAHEIQDSCEGHPQSAGVYHYHTPSSCMPNVDKQNTVVGYALDGYPITSLYDTSGSLYTNADLDACHGTTGTYTDANGTTHTGYHYVLTQEYPYTLGCYHGTPVHMALPQSSGPVPNKQSAQTTQTSGTQSGPPQAAITACAGSASGNACSFNTPNGTVSGTCRMPPSQSQLACVPN